MLGALAALGPDNRAQAHLGNISYTDIDVVADRVLWRLKYAVHLTPGLPAGQSVPPTRSAVLELQDDIERWLNETVEITTAGGRCQGAVENLIGPDAKGDLQVLAGWKCPDYPISSLHIVFRAFENRLSDWQNIASVRLGGKTYNTVFTSGHTRLTLGAAGDLDGTATAASSNDSGACTISDRVSCSEGPGHFFALGLRQMLTGYDHLLFLVTVLLVGVGMTRLLSIVAAFTLGHSITLALAALGLLVMPTAAINVAIALSVVFVAAENILTIGSERRIAVTFVLGLLHGFGFAGALAASALRPDAVALPLLAFHGGIETGQLAVLALLVPALHAVARTDSADSVRRSLSILAVMAGLSMAAARIAAMLG